MYHAAQFEKIHKFLALDLQYAFSANKFVGTPRLVGHSQKLLGHLPQCTPAWLCHCSYYNLKINDRLCDTLALFPGFTGTINKSSDTLVWLACVLCLVHVIVTQNMAVHDVNPVGARGSLL